MADKKINVRVQQKYDTESNWKSKNPVLLAGEIGVTSDGTNKNKHKVGDGSSKWIDLPYAKAELASTDVTGALGFTPANVNHNHDSVYSKLGHTHSYLPLSGGTISGGVKITGRYQNSGDDEGLVIGLASNNYSGVCLGNPTGERSVFYFTPEKPFWRYTNSSGESSDIIHPKKVGTIALTSDIPSSLPASDVYSWAKASSKPSYTKSEVGLGNVDNTSDSQKSVKYATSAGSASSASSATTAGTCTGNSATATSAVDYNNTSAKINIGYSGDGISGDDIKYIAGYTTGTNGASANIKDISKDALKSWLGLGSLAYSSATIPTIPSSLPANGGNASTVNGHTVNTDVPSGAVFTDTDTWRPLGTTADTACAGNDSRLSNARPASDVYSWAKASSKPSYSWNEIGNKPSTFTPSSHSHAISDITNLQNTLNGKAASNHSHSNYVTWTNKIFDDPITLKDVSGIYWKTNANASITALSMLNSDGSKTDKSGMVVSADTVQLTTSDVTKVIGTFTLDGLTIPDSKYIYFGSSNSNTRICGANNDNIMGSFLTLDANSLITISVGINRIIVNQSGIQIPNFLLDLDESEMDTAWTSWDQEDLPAAG